MSIWQMMYLIPGHNLDVGEDADGGDGALWAAGRDHNPGTEIKKRTFLEMLVTLWIWFSWGLYSNYSEYIILKNVPLPEGLLWVFSVQWGETVQSWDWVIIPSLAPRALFISGAILSELQSYFTREKRRDLSCQHQTLSQSVNMYWPGVDELARQGEEHERDLLRAAARDKVSHLALCKDVNIMRQMSLGIIRWATDHGGCPHTLVCPPWTRASWGHTGMSRMMMMIVMKMMMIVTSPYPDTGHRRSLK